MNSKFLKQVLLSVAFLGATCSMGYSSDSEKNNSIDDINNININNNNNYNSVRLNNIYNNEGNEEEEKEDKESNDSDSNEKNNSFEEEKTRIVIPGEDRLNTLEQEVKKMNDGNYSFNNLNEQTMNAIKIVVSASKQLGKEDIIEDIKSVLKKMFPDKSKQPGNIEKLVEKLYDNKKAQLGVEELSKISSDRNTSLENANEINGSAKINYETLSKVMHENKSKLDELENKLKILEEEKFKIQKQCSDINANMKAIRDVLNRYNHVKKQYNGVKNHYRNMRHDYRSVSAALSKVLDIKLAKVNKEVGKSKNESKITFDSMSVSANKSTEKNIKKSKKENKKNIQQIIEEDTEEKIIINSNEKIEDEKIEDEKEGASKKTQSSKSKKNKNKQSNDESNNQNNINNQNNNDSQEKKDEDKDNKNFTDEDDKE